MDKTCKYVISINREVGSGGRTIGRKLAERLGVKFYDKAVINELVKKFELSEEEVERLKAQRHHWFFNLSQTYIEGRNIEERFGKLPPVATSKNMYKVEKELLKGIADCESCVIAGRSAFNILRDEPNNFKIFIESTLEKRVERMMKNRDITEEEALQTIKMLDESRETYTKKFAKKSRYDSRNYDLMLNVATLTEDEAVDIILYAFGKFMKAPVEEA